jgi:hypothetical protein
MSWVTKKELNKNSKIYNVFGVLISSNHKKMVEVLNNIVYEQKGDNKLGGSRIVKENIEKLNPELTYRKNNDNKQLIKLLKNNKKRMEKRILFLENFNTEFNLQDLCLLEINKVDLRYYNDFIFKLYINRFLELRYYKYCILHSGMDTRYKNVYKLSNEQIKLKYETGLKVAMIANFLKNIKTQLANL